MVSETDEDRLHIAHSHSYNIILVRMPTIASPLHPPVLERIKPDLAHLGICLCRCFLSAFQNRFIYILETALNLFI